MKKKDTIAQIIRVDHAGEFGARQIYQGQMDFTKNPKTVQKLKEMYDSELEHLSYFEEQIKTRNIRPTILHPLWKVTGYALGAITAKLGEKAAMACTYAIEDVIEEHYQEQIDSLGDDKLELKENIKKFQSEEVHHKEIAIEYDAKDTPFYNAIDKIVRISSKTAIWLSKKF